MEELRRQLGEQWKGAFPQAAIAMEMTTAELSKLIENGKLASDEFLPKFIERMNSFVKTNGMLEASMKKVNAEQTRFTSTLQLAVREGFMAGVSGFGQFYRDLALAVNDNIPVFRAFGSVLGNTLRGVSTIIRTFSPVLAIFGGALDTTRKAMERASDADINWKNLTAIESVFRAIAIAAVSIDIALLWVSLGLEKISKMFGASEKDADGFAKQFSSLLITLALGAVGFKILRKALKFLISPATELFGWLNRISGGYLAKGFRAFGKVIMASIVWPLKQAAKLLSFIVSKTPGAKAAAQKLTQTAAPVASSSKSFLGSLLKGSLKGGLFGATIGVGGDWAIDKLNDMVFGGRWDKQATQRDFENRMKDKLQRNINQPITITVNEAELGEETARKVVKEINRYQYSGALSDSP